MTMQEFIRNIPKAELHLHVEGTLEPEMMLALAERNGIRLPYRDAAEVRRAYRFRDLQSFLDLYYAGAAVLRTSEDFRELAAAYLRRAARDGVRHAEIFFDPQTHRARGVALGTVVEGLAAALAEARRELGVSAALILCFLRDESVESALATLEEALPFRDRIVGVGLDSAEVGNPPGKFREVFRRAREAGFLPVAHAGEEGPAAYVREALDELGARRIDHGVRCLEDPELVRRLAAEQVPLTVCPLSNVRLGVFPRIEDHPLRRLMENGLRVTVNSDDPAYFGGYLAENLSAVQAALGLARGELRRLAEDSFRASFLPEDAKEAHLAEVAAYAAADS